MISKALNQNKVDSSTLKIGISPELIAIIQATARETAEQTVKALNDKKEFITRPCAISIIGRAAVEIAIKKGKLTPIRFGKRKIRFTKSEWKQLTKENQLTNTI